MSYTLHLECISEGKSCNSNYNHITLRTKTKLCKESQRVVSSFTTLLRRAQVLSIETIIGQMLFSMDTCYNCEPMLFTRYVFMKNKVIGEKNEFRKKLQLQPYCAEPTFFIPILVS